MSNIKLENLEINGFHLYQDKNNFNFGIDAVLLANFVLRECSALNSSSPKTNVNAIKICDLCSGSLPIPLIIYAKSSMNPKPHIDAFEIDESQVKLSQKSILWNKENVALAKNINNDLNVYNEDIKNIFLDKNKYKNLYETYDIVTVNPPYNKKGS